MAAQVLGIWLADAGWIDRGPAAVLAAAAVGVGVAVRHARVRAAASLLLALASGALALAVELERTARGAPEGTAEHVVEARVEHVRGGVAGLDVDLGRVLAIGPDAPAVAERLRVRVPPEADAAIFEPGARIRSRLRWSAPRALRNPGRPRDPRALARRGIGAVARPVDPALSVRIAAPVVAQSRLHRLRGALAARLARAGEGSGLVRALALGDTGSIDPATRDRFARLGVSHLLAVSGLHLALVAGAVYAVSRRALARSAALAARRDVRGPARAAALLAAAGYALLCGLGVPVRRALVLLAAVVVASARARRHPPLHPLAAAAALVLAWQPEALFAPGAQLSFAACAALVWSASRGREPPDRPPSRLADAVGTSATAAAVTAPLAAWHFGSAAPVAVAANLVAIPWTAGVLLPASLLAVIAAAAAPPSLADPVIGAAAWLAAGSLRAGAWLADRVPAGSGVRVHPAAIAVAGVLALGALRLRAAPARAALATLVAVVLWLAPPPRLPPDPPRLVVLDVGRGDGVLVQGRGGAALIDAGSALDGRFDLGASSVVPALRALGVSRLELAIATHADLDHRGGLPAVIRALPTGELWLPHGARDEPGFDALRAAARETGVAVQEVGSGSAPRAIGDLRLVPLWPPREATRGSRNERSLALRVESGGRRALLLGDLGVAETALLAASPDLAADVLLLPHHGSRGSSGAALLAAVAPAVAIVSAPCPAQRGLPHPDALARARRAGASVWWTGRDGAVSVGLGERLSVHPFAPARECAGAAAVPSDRPATPPARTPRASRTSRTGGRWRARRRGAG